MHLLSVMLLAGCVSPRPAPADSPTAGLGQAARTGTVRVIPLALLEDSRCPALVRCVWAGRLRIQASIQYRGGSEEQSREMILGEPINLPEGKLTLIAAVPAPEPGRTIPPAAYRFTFTLTP